LSHVIAEDTTAVDLARAGWYRALAAAVRDPHRGRADPLADAGAWAALDAAAALLREQPGVQSLELAPGEVAPDALDPAALREAWRAPDRIAHYDSVFGLVVSKECPPYETWYCPQTFSIYRSQHLADISGFYRAFGVEPSTDRPERADFVGIELEFMAWLIQKELHARSTRGPDSEEVATCRDAQRSFLKDHLAWWAPAFALALRKVADGISDERELETPTRSALGAFGKLLAAFIAIERALLGVAAPTQLVQPAGTDEDSPGCAECPGGGE
jgi:TorA maturation chaperone TorD